MLVSLYEHHKNGTSNLRRQGKYVGSLEHILGRVKSFVLTHWKKSHQQCCNGHFFSIDLLMDNIIRTMEAKYTWTTLSTLE